MAMNTSFYIEYLISNFKSVRNKLETGIVYFTFGLIALIAFALPFAVFFLFKSKLNEYVFWYILLAIISLYCGYVISKSLYKKKFAQVFYTTVLFMCGIVITVIPLSKMYYNNTGYYAASDIQAIEKKFNIKTYEGDEFVPEITWNYGNYIPNLESGENITMPADTVYGLLADSITVNSLQQKFPAYNFEKYTEVDLNALSKNEKGYNTRLVKNYYIVQKIN
jgi:hypothetical protein